MAHFKRMSMRELMQEVNHQLYNLEVHHLDVRFSSCALIRLPGVFTQLFPVEAYIRNNNSNSVHGPFPNCAGCLVVGSL